MKNATTDHTRSMNDRGAAGSWFASAKELHTSAALVIQVGRVFFTVHNQSEISLVQAGPTMAKEAQVQVELILPTSETLLEDTLSTPTDTSDRATTEARMLPCHILLGGEKWHVTLPLGGAQLVTEEPNLSRRSPALQSKIGAWPWVSMALDDSSADGQRRRRLVSRGSTVRMMAAGDAEAADSGSKDQEVARL
ncbi:hypothetical protein Syun_014460 [Stephania yunnanensis]|uniref:Uncharacterized protein n=1 Tax=Stephania yunnanensis TaxID=152371 RepID=A0AAP0PBV3_9MAGN